MTALDLPASAPIFGRVTPAQPIPQTSSDQAATQALVTGARRGDADAFARLVRQYQPLVFRWALGITGSADEADDVTQEVFVIVYRRLGQYRGDSSLDGWLYRITRRHATAGRRRHARRRQLALSPRARPEREVYTTDPGARVDREKLSAELRAAVVELPPRQREMLDLVDLQGYQPAEAAALTGTNHSTVRAHLFKARAAVRERLLRAVEGGTP